MPVRSLNSSVLKWPDAKTVGQAVRRWANTLLQERPDITQVGYFGSYARGDWGVGSDLDVVLVVASSNQPFERRSAEWDTAELPVPTQLLVYTESEWESLRRDSRFYQTLSREVVWIYQRQRRGARSRS